MEPGCGLATPVFGNIAYHLAFFQFLQVCIIQRSMFTASDAIYCAKFVELCHKMQSENFSTLIYFDRIFSDVSHIVTNCTDNEASRFVWVFV